MSIITCECGMLEHTIRIDDIGDNMLSISFIPMSKGFWGRLREAVFGREYISQEMIVKKDEFKQKLEELWK